MRKYVIALFFTGLTFAMAGVVWASSSQADMIDYNTGEFSCTNNNSYKGRTDYCRKDSTSWITGDHCRLMANKICSGD